MAIKKWIVNWFKIVNTPKGEIDITENGTVDVSKYAEANVNVQSGANLGEYFKDELNGSNSTAGYYVMNYLVTKFPDNIPLKNTLTSLRYAFDKMRALVTAGFIDTSSVTNMSYMFNSCDSLVNVPIYDTSHLATTGYSMEYMFSNCNKLSDESLDNILQMCINAPAEMPRKEFSKSWTNFYLLSSFQNSKSSTLYSIY